MSGGFSDLPIELHHESQLLVAENCYWAQRLKKWGGKVDDDQPAAAMTGCFHVHPYVRVLGRAAVHLLSAVRHRPRRAVGDEPR